MSADYRDGGKDARFAMRWYKIGTICIPLVPILLAIIAVLLFRSCYH